MMLFRRIAHERGTAIVVVTHDHRVLDAFDTVYEMEDGVLTRTSAPAARLAHSAHPAESIPAAAGRE